MQISAPP